MSNNPKDGRGNTLNLGDEIVIFLDKPIVTGKIIELDPGGISLAINGGKGQQRPGRLVIQSTVGAAFTPGTSFATMFKIVNPQAEQVIEEIMKKDSTTQ